MNSRRDLPSVDRLASHPSLASFSEKRRVEAARKVLEQARARLVDGDLKGDLEVEAFQLLSFGEVSSLKRVINLSGVILHTGLGRARLAESVADRLGELAREHIAVEYDLESGLRGDRQSHFASTLCQLTGCEAAIAVNNAAAGVLLSLAALCAGREVILSRGQMVEIGGEFRMSDVVRQSGCRLVEVGCTNRTRISDYADAIGPDTSAILRCHPSNFKIEGFTGEPSLEELAQLAADKNVLLIDDQGSGNLEDLTDFGIPAQPTLGQTVSKGANLVIASADKLLGGPQAGLIVGDSKLIAQIRKHPLARAVRIDKLSLIALEETLRLYRDGRQSEIPTRWAMARTEAEVKGLAETLAGHWAGAIVEPGTTQVGAGSAPGKGIPTWVVGLPSRSAADLSQRLRLGTPSIISRIQNDLVWLDPRTLTERELPEVIEALQSLAEFR